MAATYDGSIRINTLIDTATAESGLSSLSGSLKTFAKTVAAAFSITAVVGFSKQIVSTAADFQAQMANVATLLDGDVTQRIDELGDSVQDLQKKTGQSAETLTNGLYQVVSAFGDTADSAKILEISAKASAAGGAAVSDAVNLISATTKGYGDTSAEAAQKASDLAFQTVKLGQTTFPELAASIGTVIPLAATLGETEEELYGAMATLTGVTGSTSEVTTQLKATFTEFLSPSTELAGALASMGYESGAAALESIGLNETLQGLLESVNGDTVAFANLFGSTEAQTAALALATTQAENFTSKTQAMYDATGATDTAFAKVQDTFSAAASRLKESVNVEIEKLGEKLLPILTQALEWLADNLDGIVGALKIAIPVAATFFALWEVTRFAEFIINAGGVVAVLSKLTTALLVNNGAKAIDAAETLIIIGLYIWDAIVKAKSTAQEWLMIAATAAWNVICVIATAVTTAFGAAIAFLTSPIGLVILAVVALIAIIYLLVTNWDKVKDAAARVWESVKNVWSAAADWFRTNVTEPVAAAFAAMKDAVVAAWNALWDGAKSVINWMLAGVESYINGIVDGINLLISGLNQVLALGDAAAQMLGFDVSLQIPELAAVSLPRLAQGAVIPPNREFVAILGDQKSGTNIEAPLDTIKQGVAEVLAGMDFGGTTRIEFAGTLAQLIRVMNPVITRQTALQGKSLVKRGAK